MPLVTAYHSLQTKVLSHVPYSLRVDARHVFPAEFPRTWRSREDPYTSRLTGISKRCRKQMMQSRSDNQEAQAKLGTIQRMTTTISKTQHRKLKIEQHEPHQTPGVSAGFLVTAPLATPVVLL